MPIHKNKKLSPGMAIRDTRKPAPGVYLIEDINDGVLTLRAPFTHRTFKVERGTYELEVVANKPSLVADLDCLIGQKIRLTLADGSTTKGVCTHIIYQGVNLDGERVKQVSQVQLDRSISTTFKWSNIQGIEQL